MVLGYFAGLMRHIDNHHVTKLNALVLEFALPAALGGIAPSGALEA
jgi:malonate transporter and related proteins